ncbi:hypothetical protein E5P55_00585 [Candidatus Pinguicoccus supinus]|uniref:Uncharacterized protein n=1 Tax=Candidatus Pinguicoccus supinus TaxID=2529394 RepID=A0A7T0BRL6_9BACT|nr:hypothetical protein E5P55_00585 [Candidatus Pinguicoccus supinus]
MKIFLINLSIIFLKNKGLNMFKAKFNLYLKNIQFSLKKLYEYLTLQYKFLYKYKNKFILIKNILSLGDTNIIVKKITSRESKLFELEKSVVNFKLQIQFKFNRLRKIVLDRFFFNIKTLIRKISIIGNIDLILNIQKQSIIYLNEYFDITNDIVSILNKY